MDKKICTLLFLRRDEEILLAMKKRGFGAGRYNGVGGKVESGETIEQALARESREEIGVTPMNYRQVAEHDFVKNSKTNPFHMYVHVYLCDEWQGEPTETDEMLPKWFDMAAIPYDKMWADDSIWLPHVLAGKKVYGEFTFNEDDSILSHNVRPVKAFPSKGTF
jgi:mutator protein MutT